MVGREEALALVEEFVREKGGQCYKSDVGNNQTQPLRPLRFRARAVVCRRKGGKVRADHGGHDIIRVIAGSRDGQKA